MKAALVEMFWIVVAGFGAAVFGVIIGYMVAGALK